MIDIRKVSRKHGGMARIIAKYDFLYDRTDNPDFYCSGIQDFKKNEKKIIDGRPFELPRVQYFPRENSEFRIKDQTGSLMARLYVDGDKLLCKAESWFQDHVTGDSVRAKLKDLNGGDSMYKVSLQKTNGRIYVLDFDVTAGFGSDRNEVEYLNWRFPELAPALVKI